MIEIKNLSKNYGIDHLVLKHIDLMIEKGDIYGLVGRSGAGKSTLLRCINGLTDYHRGELLVEGCDVCQFSKSQMRTFRKDIGMIFQHFSLLERKTVFENIALPLKCWKLPPAAIDKRVNELLALVGLTDKAHVLPRNLSGGQKQRVAIARALGLRPKILLSDEATSALDPHTTHSILELLSTINRELGITIVVVTHEMSVVQQICNKVSILESGQAAFSGSVQDVFLNHPPALRRLMGTSEMDLPESGKNIRFQYPLLEPTLGDLLTTAIHKLGIHPHILSAETPTYRSTRFHSFTTNLSDSEFHPFVAFLNAQNVPWVELPSKNEEVTE